MNRQPHALCIHVSYLMIVVSASCAGKVERPRQEANVEIPGGPAIVVPEPNDSYHLTTIQIVPFGGHTEHAMLQLSCEVQHWSLLENGDVLCLESSGLSQAWSHQEKSWRPPQLHPEAISFSHFFNFQENGFLAFQEHVLTYYHAASQTLGSFSLEEKREFNPENIHLLGPGFVLFRISRDEQGQAQTHWGLVTYGQDEPKLASFTKLPGESHQVLPCEAGCDYWATDGDSFFIGRGTGEQTFWEALSLTLQPDEENSSTMHGKFTWLQGWLSTQDEQVALFPVLGFFDDSTWGDTQFWKSKGGNPLELKKGWNRVRELALEHCVPCHKDAGFENQNVWQSDSLDILNRIDPARLATLEGNLPLMPLEPSVVAEGFTDEKRKEMIDWLVEIRDPDAQRDEPEERNSGNSSGHENKPTPLTEPLLGLFNTHCKSCHVADGNLEWFASSPSRRNFVLGRIQSGEMPPPPASLPEDEINRFAESIPSTQ